MRYLNSNETAKMMIPELGDLIVDHKIENHDWLKEDFDSWVNAFEKYGVDKQFMKHRDRIYLVNVSHLVIGHFGHSHSGYQFLITDDTSNQQYIELIKNYNSQLEEEVAKKTKHVIEMQDKLVLGMATMVEGRDNSTGGHIKRTSDCIRILVEEIKKDNILGLDDVFCNNLIKAAPMHDLGKIAVDDSILRKPGKFTPEEFEIMKTHAAEGARIVGQILDGTDDQEFAKIAVNVAHYHHERWDGSGYPKGLKGEEIPLEARIMAIADVYDALVSKRVYKESMSFEDANKIIVEGMGKHFDKSLEQFYVAARPKLEEYYRNIN
jgi:putative two-component system response regulator